MGKNSSKWVKISSKWVKISLEKVSWFSAVCLQIQLFFTEIYVIVAKGGQKWVQNFEFSKNGQKFLEKWWNFRKNLEKTRKIRVKTGNFRKKWSNFRKNMKKPEISRKNGQISGKIQFLSFFNTFCLNFCHLWFNFYRFLTLFA